MLAQNPQEQLALPSPHDIYWALMGEVEARNVQQRYELGTAIDMPFLEAPWYTQGTPNSIQVDMKALEDAALQSKNQPEMISRLQSLAQALAPKKSSLTDRLWKLVNERILQQK